MFKARDEITEYVKLPLVSACEYFWDLNILTLASSANVKDIDRNAYLIVGYDSLPDKNKEIAKRFADFIADYDEITQKFYLSEKHLIKANEKIE